MFAPPYFQYPESNSIHFQLRRPGIGDAKSLFFFEGQGKEKFQDEQAVRAVIHDMILGYQGGKVIHWLVFTRADLKLVGGFHLEGDFSSGKCDLKVDFWNPIADETLGLELLNLIKKMCFYHLQMNLLILNTELPEDWQKAMETIGGLEQIPEKSGIPIWVK